MYLTKGDFYRRFGVEEMVAFENLDEFGDPVVPSMLEVAIDDAEQEANSYIAVRYSLPLPSFPSPIVSAVADIARYRLYKDRPTELITYRYERAIRWLEQLAAGKVAVTFDPESVVVPPVSQQRLAVAAVGVQYTGGIFGSKNLDLMPTIVTPGSDSAYVWPTAPVVEIL